MSSKTVVVDDSDTSVINYYVDGALWHAETSQGEGWSSYTHVDDTSLNTNVAGPIRNATLHAATVAGTSLDFRFNGTRVGVFGSVWPPSIVTTQVPLVASEYAVINAGSMANVSTGSFHAPNFAVPKNNINFFTSDDMPYGLYVLTINVTVASTISAYYLDFIVVEVPNVIPTSSSSFSSSTSVQTQSLSSDVTTTSPPVPSSSSHPPAYIGMIVGVGGAVTICIIVTVVFIACRLARRRRRRPQPLGYQYEFVGEADEDPPPPVTPFMMPELVHAMHEARGRDPLFPPPSGPHHPYATRPPSPGPTLSHQDTLSASSNTGLPPNEAYLSTATSSTSSRGGDPGGFPDAKALPLRLVLASNALADEAAPPAYTPR